MIFKTISEAIASKPPYRGWATAPLSRSHPFDGVYHVLQSASGWTTHRYASPSHCVSAHSSASHTHVSADRRRHIRDTRSQLPPVVTPADTKPSMTSSSAPWRQPTYQPDLNHRRCHVMTANVRTGSAQRRGRRAAAWSGISLVQTYWLPVILTGRCLDQAPWPRRRKHKSDPSAACSQRRTTLSESPSRHCVH